MDSLFVLHLCVAVLASWRLTELITMDRISEPFRRRFPHYLWGCPRCVSVWAGIACTVAFCFVPWLLWPLALSWLFIVKLDWGASARKVREDRVQVEVERLALQREHRRLHPIAGGSGEPWEGIIASSRAIDWSTAGVEGGIPSAGWANCTTANCVTVLNGTVNSTSIGNAIADASAAGNQIVRLPTGSFTVGSGIDISGKSNVVLRGQGASQTKLTFTGSTGCNFSTGAAICIRSGENVYGRNDSGFNTASWQGGFSAGTSVVTLSSTANLAVGRVLMLDQLLDGSDGYPATGDLYICAACAHQPDEGVTRPNRGQTQVVKVTNISGNQVTISPPLRMNNWRLGQSPGAWWGSSNTPSKIGIEDLTLDVSPISSPAVLIFNVLNPWVKGVRVVQTRTTDVYNPGTAPNGIVAGFRHIRLLNVGRATIRDNYFYGPTRTGAGSSSGVDTYGITAEVASDTLVENNIVIESPGALQINGPDTGSVWAYNYHEGSWVNTVTHHKPNFMLLYEGNSGSGVNGDIIHASAALATQFRNHWFGGASGQTSNTIQWLASFHRFYNLVGNVLGSATGNNTYQNLLTVSGSEIYSLGENDANASDTPNSGFPGTDPRVAATLFRWGNYDTATGTTRFLSSEVPCGAPCGNTNPNFSNPVPASQVLPASFYLSGVPSWWSTPYGTPPFPPVGPDVTDGTLSGFGSHVNKIPARLCFENAAPDPSYSAIPPVLMFNASTCYGVASTPPSSFPGPNDFFIFG